MFTLKATPGSALRTLGPTLFALVLASTLIAPAHVAASIGHDVSERLRGHVETGFTGRTLTLDDVRLHSPREVAALYNATGFQPAWSENGTISAQARDLGATLADTGAHGLSADTYHRAMISAFLRQDALQPAELVDLDLLLTDAWLTFGSHLLRGRLNPTAIDPTWRESPQERDLVEVLTRAVAANRAVERLDDLAPYHGGYQRLIELLAHYRALETVGGYPRVDASATLRLGDNGPEVARLRERLERSGDFIASATPTSDAFDAALEIAVKRYQRRHGLDDDGIVGPRTLAELDRPVSERILQVQRNLERWRWLPQDLGSRYVLVDIAGFELRVVENERSIMEMRVIVGRQYRQTPVFSDRIRYLVLSPYWHVPTSIAVNDILPQVRRDPGFLRAQGFTVLSGWGGDARVIDPATVDWANVPERGFPYRFRQDPGPLNALGQVKFMFPNEFNVYLHDTPARGLFARTARDFSSGCIRIERPMDLAEYLLADQPDWTRDRIHAGMNQTRERDVPLRTAVPVHMIYLTVWTDPDGTAYFRPDVYDRDSRLDGVLFN